MINFSDGTQPPRKPNPIEYTIEELLHMHHLAATTHAEDPTLLWIDIGVPIHKKIVAKLMDVYRECAMICDEEYEKGGREAAARAAARIRDRMPHGV